MNLHRMTAFFAKTKRLEDKNQTFARKITKERFPMVQYKRTCLFRKLAVRYDRILAEVTNYAYKTFRGYAS